MATAKRMWAQGGVRAYYRGLTVRSLALLGASVLTAA